MATKSIILHGPAIGNDGKYIDAGATVTVGDAADQIAATRAADLIERSLAVETAPAKAS